MSYFFNLSKATFTQEVQHLVILSHFTTFLSNHIKL